MPSSHQAKKQFGQNFLQDSSIISQCISAVSANVNDHLVEIGPGQGALTQAVIATQAKLNVIEIDNDLINRLQTIFGCHDNFTLHHQDVLTVDFSKIQQSSQPLRVFGNLPYNIATKIITGLLNKTYIHDMHFMVQLEVAERLLAGRSSSHRGRLSVFTQYFCHIEKCFDIPPEAFQPAPKVMSSFIRLIPKPTESLAANLDIPIFEKTLQVAFTHRRKTLKNNFKGILQDSDFEKLEIASHQRPQDLTNDDFVNLALYISSHNLLS